MNPVVQAKQRTLLVRPVMQAESLEMLMNALKNQTTNAKIRRDTSVRTLCHSIAATAPIVGLAAVTNSVASASLAGLDLSVTPRLTTN